MARPELQLPTLQNWSCHNCSGCCRQHVIEITAEEKKRIEAQGWDTDSATSGRPVVLTQGTTHRLAHQPDGACVFLDDDGLCRIHAKFGEPAKPLACRIYPFAFHPAGDELAISLRFSCPSVVENKGVAVSSRRSELTKIARLVVPDSFREVPPPEIRPGQRTSWDDFLQFVGMLDAIFREDTPVLVAVLRCLVVTELLGEASFEKISGERLVELLQLVAQTALSSVDSVPQQTRPPRGVAARHLRMLVAQYTRRDTMADADAGLRGYWRRLMTSLAFTRGRGVIPSDRPEFGVAAFRTMEEPFEMEDAEAIEEILRRYFRVKIQGIHFCGRAYYDAPLVEGLHSLLLVWPAVMWLARWRAAGEGRRVVQAADVALALSVADHNHGYSQVLGLRSSRYRVRILSAMKQIAPLCVWYSRTV